MLMSLKNLEAHAGIFTDRISRVEFGQVVFVALVSKKNSKNVNVIYLRV